MIKKYWLSIVSIILFMILASTSIFSNYVDETIQINENNENTVLVEEEIDTQFFTEKSQSTRNVMAEMLSTTWCPNCPRAEREIFELFNSDQYSFQFVTLVIDKSPGESAINPPAYNRARWLSAAYIPMLYLDGGYEVADSVNNYGNTITQLLNRDTNDLAIDVSSEWLGDAQVEITVAVTNNEPSNYIGHLRVYVTEIESRWTDNDGDAIPYALLDFALNKYITIAAGETYTETTIFDGASDHAGNTYEDITPENIYVIGSISHWLPHIQTNPWEQPKPNRFFAQYVDNAAGSTMQ